MTDREIKEMYKLTETPFIEMPYDVLLFNNGHQPCDLLKGPCCCGAWHEIDDAFKLTNNVNILKRIAKIVTLCEEAMVNTEVENETKFLLCAARRENFVTWRVSTLLNKYKPSSSGDHLIVYYDSLDKTLLRFNHTFRITLRKSNGVVKNRITYKRNDYNEGNIRTCTEFHYPLSEHLNPHKSNIKGKHLPEGLEQESILGLFRDSWIRVKRHVLNINGIECNVDICKTNKGVYFEELETEEPITQEWISALEKDIGPLWQSNVNKYKRTVLVNQM